MAAAHEGVVEEGEAFLVRGDEKEVIGLILTFDLCPLTSDPADKHFR